MYCGIPGFGVQDQAVQESQGDRSSIASIERLGTSDTAIIQVRKRLMTAARALRERGDARARRGPARVVLRALDLGRAARGRAVGRGRSTPLVVVRPDQSLTLA